MKKSWIAGLVVLGAFGVWAETVTNGLDLQGGLISGHGYVPAGDNGLAFTNYGIRDLTLSAGQLSGVDPETGAVITNAANLLSLKAESLTAVSNVTAGGSFVGDGSRLTNLNVNSFSGTLNASSLPGSGVWDAAGLTITNASLAGDVTVQSLTVSTNLTVQGIISGDGSGLSHVAAGGTDGSLQFNRNGQLEGNTNFFIHATTGKLAFNAQGGNIFRTFRGNDPITGNMTFVLRSFEDTTEVCMFNNGVETIRLRGDGSIYASGTVEVGGLSLGGGETSGSTGWFVPEEGDLSMGTFTQQ
ncbi:MAG: hypothetical protein PHP93_04130 [Kiritimatiellales bacterium]|nr:hypothetical protein [Kiritimatiellales bacterium]